MELKRFVQLFVVYAFSIVVPLALIKIFEVHSFFIALIILIVLGYILLGLPLTLMTLAKQKK